MAARLLLFNPYSGGHHPDHVAWIAEAWHRLGVNGELVLAVSPALLDARPDIADLVGPGDHGSVRAVRLREAEAFESEMGLAESTLRHDAMISRLLAQEAPEHLFALYLDHAQAAFARPRRRSRSRLSGLLFRPDLHLPAASVSHRARRLRKRALLRALLRARAVEAVFTLDPTAADALRALSKDTAVFAVPDPAPTDDPTGADGDVRRAHSVEAGRALWVVPGVLTPRKGILALTEAVRTLPVPAQRRVCLLFAGEAVGSSVPAIEEATEGLALDTEVQVVWDRRFLPADELQASIAQADLVLAPYIGHVGSSGVVMRAAAAGRPIIAQADGLIGWQVRHHALGQTVHAENTDALADTLLRALGAPDHGFDPARARAFAEAHTVSGYVDAILGPLGLLPPLR